MQTDRCVDSYDNIWHNSSCNDGCFRQSCNENKNAHFMFKNLFPENHAVCELTWENTTETDRPQMGVKQSAEKVRFARRISKATDTHSLYLILIALPVKRKRLVQCLALFSAR